MVFTLLTPGEKLWWKLRWLWVAVLIWLIGVVFSFNADWANSVYRIGFFSPMRSIIDGLIHALGFSTGWIFLFIFALSLFGFFKSTHWKDWTSWVGTASKFFVFFYVLWGYNYKASGVQDLMGLKGDGPDSRLKQVILRFDDELSHQDLSSLRTKTYSSQTKSIRNELQSFLAKRNLPAAGKPVIRAVNDGWLRRLGISGIYFPYTFEAYVDAGQIKSAFVFTAAHECAHAFGYTDEGEASFLACAALMESGIPEFQSIARYELLKQSLRRLSAESPEVGQQAYDELHDELKALIEFEKSDNEKYASWFSSLSGRINHYFLRFQGVEDGSDSYDRFLDLYLQWEESEIGR